MDKRRLAQRTAGLGLAATLGLGIIGPAASAETTSNVRMATQAATLQQALAASSTEGRALMGVSAGSGQVTMSEAQFRAEMAKRGWRWSAVKKAWNYLKKKLPKKQITKLKNAAKRKAAFKREWNKVPWHVRWTIKAMLFFADPIDVLMWIFTHWA